MRTFAEADAGPQTFTGKWKLRQVGELAEVDSDSLSSRTRPDFAFNYIAIDSVATGRLVRYTEESFASSPSRARRVVKSRDVLMSTVRPALHGHLFYLGCPPNAICSTGFAVIRAKPDRCEPRFLFAHLFGRAVDTQLQGLLSGSNYPAVSSGDVRGLRIPCPPSLAEQRAIAAVLTDVDDLIESLEALIAKKRAIKTATMQQLLTGRTRLPGFGGEWEVRRFAELLRQIPSKQYQIAASQYCAAGRFPVVDQGRGVHVGYSDNTDRVFTPSQHGIIVFGDHTRVIKFYRRAFVLGGDGTCLFEAGSRCVLLAFVFHALCLDLHHRVPNTGYNRHFKFLANSRLPLPPLPEQRAIATVLTDMDAEITALERRLDKTRDLKRGMMQQLLTGAIRLPIPEDAAEHETTP